MLRRLPTVTLPLLAAFAIVALAACSSGSAPGWTYAPAASASAAASGAASGEPSGSPAASASAAASADLSPAPSGAGSASPGASGGTALTVTAPQGAATAGFEPKELEGPANAAFTVTFDNQDTTTSPHDWVLKNPSGALVPIGGDTSFFSGPAKRDYQVPALAPGAYTYVCQVHPAVMTGTLTIK